MVLLSLRMAGKSRNKPKEMEMTQKWAKIFRSTSLESFYALIGTYDEVKEFDAYIDALNSYDYTNDSSVYPFEMLSEHSQVLAPCEGKWYRGIVLNILSTDTDRMADINFIDIGHSEMVSEGFILYYPEEFAHLEPSIRVVECALTIIDYKAKPAEKAFAEFQELTKTGNYFAVHTFAVQQETGITYIDFLLDSSNKKSSICKYLFGPWDDFVKIDGSEYPRDVIEEGAQMMGLPLQSYIEYLEIMGKDNTCDVTEEEVNRWNKFNLAKTTKTRQERQDESCNINAVNFNKNNNNNNASRNYGIYRSNKANDYLNFSAINKNNNNTSGNYNIYCNNKANDYANDNINNNNAMAIKKFNNNRKAGIKKVPATEFRSDHIINAIKSSLDGEYEISNDDVTSALSNKKLIHCFHQLNALSGSDNFTAILIKGVQFVGKEVFKDSYHNGVHIHNLSRVFWHIFESVATSQWRLSEANRGLVMFSIIEIFAAMLNEVKDKDSAPRLIKSTCEFFENFIDLYTVNDEACDYEVVAEMTCDVMIIMRMLKRIMFYYRLHVSDKERLYALTVRFDKFQKSRHVATQTPNFDDLNDENLCNNVENFANVVDDFDNFGDFHKVPDLHITKKFQIPSNLHQNDSDPRNDLPQQKLTFKNAFQSMAHQTEASSTSPKTATCNVSNPSNFQMNSQVASTSTSSNSWTTTDDSRCSSSHSDRVNRTSKDPHVKNVNFLARRIMERRQMQDRGNDLSDGNIGSYDNVCGHGYRNIIHDVTNATRHKGGTDGETSINPWDACHINFDKNTRGGRCKIIDNRQKSYSNPFPVKNNFNAVRYIPDINLENDERDPYHGIDEKTERDSNDKADENNVNLSIHLDPYEYDFCDSGSNSNEVYSNDEVSNNRNIDMGSANESSDVEHDKKVNVNTNKITEEMNMEAVTERAISDEDKLCNNTSDGSVSQDLSDTEPLKYAPYVLPSKKLMEPEYNPKNFKLLKKISETSKAPKITKDFCNSNENGTKINENSWSENKMNVQMTKPFSTLLNNPWNKINNNSNTNGNNKPVRFDNNMDQGTSNNDFSGLNSVEREPVRESKFGKNPICTNCGEKGHYYRECSKSSTNLFF